MNDEPNIPLLTDLLYRGHLDSPSTTDHDADEQSDLEIATEEQSDPAPISQINEEEIRQILDRHMDHAYAEIIRLLEQKKT